MQQFDLSLWLKDKSRKVVTRDGKPVRLVCWDKLGDQPIISCIKYSDDYEDFETYNIDGSTYSFREDKNDLFFADEEEKLTEFEQELRYWILQSLCNYENNGCVSDNMTDSVEVYLKDASKKLLDLARKELQPEFDKEMDKMLAETDKVVYQKGKQDALKDLPKWKKVDSNPPKVQYNLQGNRLYKDGEYYF